MSETQVCRICLTEQPIEVFLVGNRRGLTCYACAAIKRRERSAVGVRRRKNPPRPQRKDPDGLPASQRVPFVKRIKAVNGCADCGTDEALTFDHLPQYPKAFDIWYGAGHTSLWTDAELLAEIAKCEVVCVWCHGRRGASRIRYPRDYDEHAHPPVIPTMEDA